MRPQTRIVVSVSGDPGARSFDCLLPHIESIGWTKQKGSLWRANDTAREFTRIFGSRASKPQANYEYFLTFGLRFTEQTGGQRILHLFSVSLCEIVHSK